MSSATESFSAAKLRALPRTVIKFILFVCSCYSRLSIKLIVHMHFHVLHAYILVHLTGEHEKHVLSDKLKCKGRN